MSYENFKDSLLHMATLALNSNNQQEFRSVRNLGKKYLRKYPDIISIIEGLIPPEQIRSTLKSRLQNKDKIYKKRDMFLFR